MPGVDIPNARKSGMAGRLRLRLLASLAIAMGAILGAAPAKAACEAELAELDRRLEDPKLTDKQRQIVQGMRQSADYLCSAGQEADIRRMLERLDAMLNAPGIGSPLPGQTRARPASSERRTESAPATSVVEASGRGQRIDRPEDMFQYWYQDVDHMGDTLRVLYTTSPSLEQGQAGPWTANVYVVEVSADGEATQHRLYSKEELETVTMALLPGEDRTLVQMRALGPGKPERLEVWSVPEGNVLSSAEIPSRLGPDDRRWT